MAMVKADGLPATVHLFLFTFRVMHNVLMAVYPRAAPLVRAALPCFSCAKGLACTSLDINCVGHLFSGWLVNAGQRKCCA